ncbi:MAG TPA: phenylalanine--tRNA ligase subunit beta [Candidatus Paceibacterota bacterium]
MKYSYNWLQTHIEEKFPPIEELEQKIIFHAFEVEGVEAVGADTVMEIKVLPDRAGDCLSHFGMARELAGLLGLTLKQKTPLLVTAQNPYPVTIESDWCNRYIAIHIEGVSVGPSPDWLKERLESVGQKSINNIVDATNFVLFDSGQPTHAFDADKITGGITVRLAHIDETITTLSNETKALATNDLLIADDKGALAIAGVKGGNKAEVTTETKNIVLEIANFDAAAVRKTSRKLGLITDASKRFENNFSPVIAADAAAHLAALITEIAGGHVVAMNDVYPAPEAARTISFSTDSIARILGNSIDEKTIANVFDRYHYSYTSENNIFSLSVPYYRRDITGAHDIAEEVGRVIGYDAIAPLPIPFSPQVHENLVDTTITAVKKYLVDKGFSEVLTYTFQKKGDVFVAYGARDKSALRTNLADGLKESFALNRLNAPLLSVAEVKLFEIGTVFFSGNEEVHVATIDKNGVHESRIPDFVETNNINANELHLDISKEVVVPFKPWSLYPFIVRDIAVWLPEGDGAAKNMLEKIVTEFSAAHTATPAVMFDTFSKEGRVSYAYRFVFQSSEKTLTDAEVAPLLEPLSETISRIPGAQLR